MCRAMAHDLFQSHSHATRRTARRDGPCLTISSTGWSQSLKTSGWKADFRDSRDGCPPGAGPSEQLAEQGVGGDVGGLVAGEGIGGDEIAVDDELECVRGLELVWEVGEGRVEFCTGLFHLDKEPGLLIADDDEIENGRFWRFRSRRCRL